MLVGAMAVVGELLLVRVGGGGGACGGGQLFNVARYSLRAVCYGGLRPPYRTKTQNTNMGG